MNILLYNHGSSYNHGCEALLRTVAGTIIKRFPDASFTVSSLRPAEDREMIKEGFDFVASDNFSHMSFKNRRLVVGSIATVFHNIPNFTSLYRGTVEAAKKADAMISVGGDTFSYGKSAELTTVSRKLRKYCDKSVLWGCSIDEKFLVGDEFRYKVKGLKEFSLITARESITYETFKKLGFENVKLYPDPAFTLESAPQPPMFDNGRDTVGINISPLIMNYEREGRITFRCYAALVKRILDETEFNVALIPHVVCSDSNDAAASRSLAEMVGASDRVKILDGGNAVEIKGAIGQCRFFAAARTHASIAAYSQKIPTLVVGYSVKSRGIARDIFGTEEGYVIPVQSLDNEDALADAFFKNVVGKEDAIRSKYDEVMPSYIEQADAAADEFARLMTGGSVW